VVGRLVRVRRQRLVTLQDQHRQIVQAQRRQQEAAVLAERLCTAERLRPVLVEALQTLVRRAEDHGEFGEIEAAARELLARTREEVLALTAPVDIQSSPASVPADHVRVLRSSAQRWVVLGAGTLAVGQAVETTGTLPRTAPAWTVVPSALAIGIVLSFAWWRPLAAVALTFALTAAYSHLIAHLPGSLSMAALAMTMAFVVGALTTRRTAVAGLVVSWVGEVVAVGTRDPLGDAVVLLMCWLAGLALNEVSRLVEQSRANNQLLAQEEVVAAARAVVEERLRLARELHDAIGHSLTVVALQAGAARRMADRDPARAAAVMRTVASAAREGLAAMRADAPCGSMADLVDRIRVTGVAIESDIGDESLLDPRQRAVAYRVVQEALTNVLRHSPGARATVVVRRSADAVEVAVANSRPLGPGSGRGTGRGLEGIRERVTAADGHVTWSPLPDGGFEVRARLPVEVGAALR
jgi:signal transduction histidine kinase